METFNNIISTIDGWIWGIPLIVVILATGVYLTCRTGLLQVRQLPRALKFIVKKEDLGDGKVGDVSSFASLCTALSATIGTGNIVGVATAITAGGPGALFWMLIAAFFGMATKYAEGLLAVKYRIKDHEGKMLGGPFYYIERGMGSRWKWLAKLFAVFGAGAGLLGIGTITQVHGITSAVGNFFDPEKSFCLHILGQDISIYVVIAGLIITLAVALVVIGGIKRISGVASVVVPFMAIIYVVFCLVVICCNITAIPHAVAEIVAGAFNPGAVTGGLVGSFFIAMQSGIARGIFSNESGLSLIHIFHNIIVHYISAANIRYLGANGFKAFFLVDGDGTVIIPIRSKPNRRQALCFAEFLQERKHLGSVAVSSCILSEIELT